MTISSDAVIVSNKREAEAPSESRGGKKFRGTRADQALLKRILLGPTATDLPLLRDGDPQRHVKFSEYLKGKGLRTALITAPNLAVSILLGDGQAGPAQGDDAIWLTFGVHPDQEALEVTYAESFRHRVQACALLRSLRRALSPATLASLDGTLNKAEQSLAAGCCTPQEAESLMATTVATVVAVAPGEVRPEAVAKEVQRHRYRNCTLANALLQTFLGSTGLAIADVVLRPSATHSMTRLTITLWDPSVGAQRPSTFTLMPGLAIALRRGPEALVEEVVRRFWSRLMRLGYYPAAAFRESVSLQLAEFMRSGLVSHGRMSVAAGFTPRRHLSLYLHGKAGAGKSSFVSKLVPSLAATIEELLDPEMDVRFVKQNLNKPLGELEQELTLRPNNNDMSVMSIIQGRRMTLSQSKPGLVVVGLEEMPPAAACNGMDTHEPKAVGSEAENGVGGGDEGRHGLIEQRATVQLLVDRFQGLRGRGASKEEVARLRQQGRTGIADDATILTVFTSNYELCDSARAQLTALPMFAHLQLLSVTAIETDERKALANGYVAQQLLAHGDVDVALEMDLGDGDIRDLVRQLRVLAYQADVALYTCHERGRDGNGDTGVVVRDGRKHRVVVRQEPACEGIAGPLLHVYIDGHVAPAVSLRNLGHGNLFPLQHIRRDERSQQFARALRGAVQDDTIAEESIRDLTCVVEYWYAGVCTPAVVVVSSTVATAIATALENDASVRSIRGIDAASYRIVKSLYEGSDVRCLRDDIKECRKIHSDALVVVEVAAETTDAQLKIRELLEDTPSMIAFSTARSALQKRGLFFVVSVGQEARVTPELMSRATILLID